MNKEYAYIFEGDGRQMVEPKEEWSIPGYPTPVRRQQARDLGARFDKTGVSTHSGNGHTLWVAVAWAQYREFGTVLYETSIGYELRKTN